MTYGSPPILIGGMEVDCLEMMFFHDMPIKLPGGTSLSMEPRLKPFEGVVGRACCDFIGLRGIDAFVGSHVYICAKRLHQEPGKPFNRPGWHTDGFGTEDINYVWYDRTPTIFNVGPMELPADDVESMAEMERQAIPANDRTYPDAMLLRLDQSVVHRVGDIREPAIRTFCKITFSADRYDLAGNTKNHLLDYDWPLRQRSLTRNVPQKMI